MVAAAIGLDRGEQAAELTRLPNFTATASLLGDDGPTRPFAFRTDPPPPSDAELATAIRRRSRELWGADLGASRHAAAVDSAGPETTGPASEAQIAARTDLVRLLSRAVANGAVKRRSPTGTRRLTGERRRPPKSIRPLSQDLVRRVLDRRELRCRTNGDGYSLEFERDPESGVKPTLQIVLAGEDTILRFRVSADKAISVERKSDLFVSLNEWHRSRYWPMAFAVAREGDESQLVLVCEHSLDMSEGTSEAHVDRQYQLALRTSTQLFQWLHHEKGLI